MILALRPTTFHRQKTRSPVMTSRWTRAAWTWLIPAAILAGAAVRVFAGGSSPLVWEPEHLEVVPKLNEPTVEFSFGVTNTSDSEVVIDHVQPSCSCTVAKLPSEPWHLLPHTNGQVSVTVDLRGKAGQFDKHLTVFFANTEMPPKVLNVTVRMPDRKPMRDENMKLALADRQAVFKGDCAKCHAGPAKTVSGMELYHQVCGICHEAQPRATMVPDLRLINTHPTDYAFWKTMIANGKPGTLMPAFAVSQGGPLTDEQIDSLAKMIDAAYPIRVFPELRPQTKPALPPSMANRSLIPNSRPRKNNRSSLP
jgi:mono/diheme cytochrome c family protein